jgi:hypothetical protein
MEISWIENTPLPNFTNSFIINATSDGRIVAAVVPLKCVDELHIDRSQYMTNQHVHRRITTVRQRFISNDARYSTGVLQVYRGKILNYSNTETFSSSFQEFVISIFFSLIVVIMTFILVLTYIV